MKHIEVWFVTRGLLSRYDSVYMVKYSMKLKKGIPDWIMQTYLGRAPSERDVWCIANEKIKDNSKRKVWEGLQNIYFKNLSYDKPLYSYGKWEVENPDLQAKKKVLIKEVTLKCMGIALQ